MSCAVVYVKIFNFETHLLFLNCIYNFKFFLHKSREDFISNLLRNTEFISFHNFWQGLEIIYESQSFCNTLVYTAIILIFDIHSKIELMNFSEITLSMQLSYSENLIKNETFFT